MSEPTNPWSEIYRQEGRVFTEPHEAMGEVVQTLRNAGAAAVLDLGCGTGRHVVHLARSGFSVFGLDSAPEGIAACGAWLAEEALEADLRTCDMGDRFPFEDGLFDGVISVQALHHATLETIRHIAREITRVTRPGGFLFVTVPTLRNQGVRFEQLEENTWVPLDGPEKGLPHHYFTREELREVFASFEVGAIPVDRWKHYCLSAFRRDRT